MKDMKIVMVVDDEVDVLRLVRLSLLREGYQVITARDGAEAIDKMRHQVPDAMIVDVMMPNIDGFSLLKEVRSDDRHKKTPVIILTQKSEYQSMREAYNTGADYYITKPFRIVQVIDGLRMVLAQAEKN